jgi:tripartite-type tricarboxylate transporter receptor subunit TctC
MKKTLAVMLLATVAATPAFAEYPEKPITYILGYSPGGGSDVGVRTWAPYAATCLGNGASFTVVNMPGASGAIGTAAAEKAAPDGYTLANLNLPQFVTNTISKGAPSDVDKFDYLGTIVGVRSALAVKAGSEFKTLKEFVDYANKTDEPINVGIGGIGADDHLAGLRFSGMIGENFNFIPFGDGASARAALLGGQVMISFMSNSEAALFKNEVQPLAIAGEKRSDLWPDVATFKEDGYDLIAGSDHLIGTPKGAPADVLTKLRDCIAKVAVDPAFLADAQKRGMALNVMDAAESEAYVRAAEKIYADVWAKTPWIAK